MSSTPPPDDISERRLLIGLGALVMTMLLVMGIPVAQLLHRMCVNNYDLGIYAQALALLSPLHPNPWLTVRHVHLLADHVEPILYAAVPFARIFGPVPVGVAF